MIYMPILTFIETRTMINYEKKGTALSVVMADLFVYSSAHDLMAVLTDLSTYHALQGE